MCRFDIFWSSNQQIYFECRLGIKKNEPQINMNLGKNSVSSAILENNFYHNKYKITTYLDMSDKLLQSQCQTTPN